MKVLVKRSTQMWYTDHRTIEMEIPDGVEDVKKYIEEQMEDNDEIEDDFMDANVDDEFSDPEHLFYEVEDENNKPIIDWQDY